MRNEIKKTLNHRVSIRPKFRTITLVEAGLYRELKKKERRIEDTHNRATSMALSLSSSFFSTRFFPSLLEIEFKKQKTNERERGSLVINYNGPRGAKAQVVSLTNLGPARN